MHDNSDLRCAGEQSQQPHQRSVVLLLHITRLESVESCLRSTSCADESGSVITSQAQVRVAESHIQSVVDHDAQHKDRHRSAFVFTFSGCIAQGFSACIVDEGAKTDFMLTAAMRTKMR